MNMSGGAQEGPQVHYGSPEEKQKVVSTQEVRKTFQRLQSEHARILRQMERRRQGKNPHTMLERIARAAKSLYPKRTLEKAAAEGRLTMATLLGKTREPVYREGENIYDGPLSRKLERHGLTPEKLAQNTAEYPELVRELTEEEQRQVALIRDVLLQVPLIHATRKNINEEADLIPAREISDDEITNTEGLDRDLGLDEYTFFHWGFPFRKYGSNFLLLDAHMLLDAHTIVTPYDIFDSAIRMDQRFVQLPPRLRRKVRERYFNKMLTGERWLELMSRRILFGYQEAKAEGRPYLFREDEGSSMGEIKIHGPVSPSHIVGRISAKIREGSGSPIDAWRSLYEHGFAYGHMEDSRQEFVRNGRTNGETPEDIGVDYTQATQFWRNLLEPKSPSGQAEQSKA